MKCEPSEIESLAAALSSRIELIMEGKLSQIVARSHLPEILSTEEAANFMGVDKQTIRRERAAGRLQSLKIGKSYRFRRQDILSLFEKSSGDQATLPFSREKQAVAQFN